MKLEQSIAALERIRYHVERQRKDAAEAGARRAAKALKRALKRLDAELNDRRTAAQQVL